MKDEGAALTMESIIAAMILIGALSFIIMSFPMEFHPTNQYSQIQLREYGKNYLFSSAHPVLEKGEIAYQLNREYSPRPEGDSEKKPGNKWNFDYKNKENISIINYEKTDYNWTTNHLIIDYDDEIWPDGYNESLNINYLIKYNPESNYFFPDNNGTLYQYIPFTKKDAENAYAVKKINNNSVKVKLGKRY